MSRKDDIFQTFLSHPLLKEEYGLTEKELSITLRSAENSDIPIIKAIALLVSTMESKPVPSENSLKNMITKYLNTAAL